MKHILFILLFIGITIQFTQAQIKVSTNNNVGIGTETPVSKLSVGNSGNTLSKVYFENTTGLGSSIKTLQVYQPAPTTIGSWAYATWSSIQVSTIGYKHVGLYSSAYPTSAISGARTFGSITFAGNGESGYNYGLYAGLVGSSNGTAILAVIPGRTDLTIPGMYAAYLRGNVFIEDNLGIKNTSPSYPLHVTGDIKVSGTVYCTTLSQSSDRSLKTDIKNLESGSLDKIQLLNGVSYKYKVPEELISKLSSNVVSDTGSIEKPLELPNPELYEAEQIGLIAQDVQKIFPQLVVEDKEGTLGVNYIGLIPVMIEAIKEQEETIKELQSEVELLKSKSKIL